MVRIIPLCNLNDIAFEPGKQGPIYCPRRRVAQLCIAPFPRRVPHPFAARRIEYEGPKNQVPAHSRRRRAIRTGYLVSRALLLGPRLRRHKACEAVVHDELAVVFTAMFDEAVCYVENARFLITVYDSLHQAFLAL